MYADDTLIVCKSKKFEDVTFEIQNALIKMFTWCTANNLNINLSKTKHMNVQHIKPDCEPAVHVNNTCISTVNSYEYLGMIMDNRLAMNDHIDNMWKKANMKVGILSKIRRFISQKTAINIYKCMIRPHLDYIDFVVESGSSDRIKKLTRLQEKAIRRIEYCFEKESRKEIAVLQSDFNIEPLSLRRKRNLVIIVHKTSKNNVNIESFKPNIALRSKPKVKLKHNFTSITKVYNSPLYRGVLLWDQLPPNLQKEENNIKFKTELNRFDWI